MKDEFERRDATLLAVTPQLGEHHRSMIEKNRLGFDLLSDPGNEYAARLGTRFALPEYLRAAYLGRGIDLPRHNGEASWTLAMPGRFVVDRAGVVRAVDVDADYTRRPEPADTLAAVAAL